MPPEKEPEILTVESVEALIAKVFGTTVSRMKEETTREVNGAIAKNVSPLVASLANIEKRFEDVVSLSAQVKSTDDRMTELMTALQAPDEDPATPTAPQPFDRDAMIAQITSDLEKSIGEKSNSRILELEKGIEAERAEKVAIAQQQIADGRRSEFLTYAQKFAPEVGLFSGIEEVLLGKMQADGRLQESEDGKSWLLKTERIDPYTKTKEQVLAPLAEALPDVLRANYTQFIQPRGGVGSNAAPTQPYSPATRKITENTSPADLQKGFASGDTAMLNEIAAMVSQGG